MRVAEASNNFLRVLDLDGRTLDGLADHVSAIHRREVDVLLVRNVFSPADMSLVETRLNAGEASSWRFAISEKFRFYSLGRCLDLSTAELAPYFEQTERFRDACAQLFRDAIDYETRVRAVISSLGGRRLSEVPSGPGGEQYMPSTIRLLPSGGYIPPHCEREQVDRPAYHHLRHVIDPDAISSFYMPISYGAAGGEILLYDFEWKDLTPQAMSGGRSNVESFIDRYPSQSFRPGVGDMIFFDGGRLFHRVTPVVNGHRWTIGGFVGTSPDHSRLYYWS